MAELTTRVPALLREIQDALLSRARAFRDEHTTHVDSWDAFVEAMAGRPGFVIARWCGSAECEAQIKAETQATLRNIPLDSVRAAGPCIKCNGPATASAWFAKAY